MKQESSNLQVGVKTLIFNKEGNILIIKRNPSLYKEVNNLWDIPGGRINSGSSLEENLKREIFEEVGIVSAKILGLISAQDIIKPNKHVVRLTYVSCATGSIDLILSEEHTEYQWVSIEDIQNIVGLDHYVRDIITDKNKLSFIKYLINKG